MQVRLRGEAGFGLIELLISMTVLNVGILAIVAAFNAGALSLRRASDLSNASVLADKQMELYRAVLHTEIRLADAELAVADATYTGDAADDAANGATVTDTSLGVACTPVVDSCDPSRETPGPDGRRYRIDTYIKSQTPTNGRPLRLVTVVVRNAESLKTLARVASTFDQSTG